MTSVENNNQQSEKTVAVQGKVNYYTQSLGRKTLASGLYKMSIATIGDERLPGFSPVEVTNDKPLEIDTGVADIVEEIGKFFDRRDVFKSMGFAHKRGYLLHGPPGCGKSSTLRLLETQFVEKYNGLVLFWDNGGALSFYVDYLRGQEPDRPIMVVCEDIDSFVQDFEESILEFLDGQKALNNFILVATTNNLNEIPSRIKDRPSRIDRVIEVKLPSEETRFQYLSQIGVAESAARDLAKRTQGLSIAKLKEIVVAVVCLEQPLGPVLERLKVADMSPLDGGDGLGFLR
jgi:energy-coupling factor transporter ATP-binding protein EcfA2